MRKIKARACVGDLNMPKPQKGRENHKQIALRWYSESYRLGMPQAIARGCRVSLICCLLVSSTQTKGYAAASRR